VRFAVGVNLALALAWLVVAILLLGGWVELPQAGIVGFLAVLMVVWNLVRAYLTWNRARRVGHPHER
jgi:hypothetical protein